MLREYVSIGLFVCKTKKYKITFNNFYTRSVQTKIQNVHTYANDKQSNEQWKVNFFKNWRATSHEYEIAFLFSTQNYRIISILKLHYVSFINIYRLL